MQLTGYNPKHDVLARRLVLKYLVYENEYETVLSSLKAKCAAYKRSDYKMPCRDDVEYMVQEKDAILDVDSDISEDDVDTLVRFVPEEAALDHPEVDAQIQAVQTWYSSLGLNLSWALKQKLFRYLLALALLGSLSYSYGLMKIVLFLANEIIVRGMAPDAVDPEIKKESLQRLLPGIKHILDQPLAENATPKLWMSAARWVQDALVSP